ncbi:MAG: alpha/beta fold hydrolase [Sphingorhabdus sp.]
MIATITAIYRDEIVDKGLKSLELNDYSVCPRDGKPFRVAVGVGAGMTESESEESFDFTNIYDLVSEPDQYDAFMRSLLSKLELLQQEDGSPQSESFGAHWGKASILVDKVTPWRNDSEGELDKFLAAKLQAMIAFDDEGNVVSANAAARSLYDLVPKAHLRDMPLSEADRVSLAKQIGDIIAGFSDRNRPNNVRRFQNQINQKPLLVTLERHCDENTGQKFAILMTNEIYWPPYLGPILQDLFNLTQAEIEIIRLMLGGAKVNEIAKARASSVTTVRSQLRAIFSKTDTASQIECVRMVFGLALMHDRDDGNLIAARIQAGVETQHYPRESQRRLFKLRNGRQIDYSIFGVENPKKRKGVILFYHDQAIGDTWFGEAVIAATRAGLQIIAPLRPGFGRTTIYDGEASDPMAFAPDIVELLDHLKIEKAALMTLRSGLVHGLAAARLMPERFTAITAANPILPATCDADLEGTNGYNLLIPKTRLHFPQALRFLCKAGFAFVTAKGPEAFALAVVRDSPRDYEWVSRPEILSLIIGGLPIHREQGYVGNYGDIAYADDWTSLLKDSPVPIRLVIGEHDRNVQWTAARRWSKELDFVDLHILPDSGYFVQHQQPAQFLDWMQQDLQLKKT